MRFCVQHMVMRLAIALAWAGLWLLPAHCSAQSDDNFLQDSMVREYTHRLIAETEFCKNDTLLFISLARQEMYVVQGKMVLKRYSVSSGKAGIGCQFGTGQTPEGIHRIYTKIGHKTRVPYIYVTHTNSRKIGKIEKLPRKSKKDFVTSRILWLAGVEEGFNCGFDKGTSVDSYRRNIYIHGTTEEGLIGSMASSGCIRMLNKDVVELYKLVPRLTYVVIMNDVPVIK